MPFAICVLAAAPVRKLPDLHSEMTSQLLFGECYEVREEISGYQRIRVAHDGYEGWIDGRQGERIDQAVFHGLVNRPPRLLAEMSAEATLGGEPLHLLRGCSLPREINGRTLQCAAGTSVAMRENFSIERLEALARAYLNVPYLWGGRAPFGIDCSGLVQMLFRFFGVQLSRDSADQAGEGEEVRDFAAARPGDVAHFSHPFSHVGLMVDGGIIHASGRVRCDDLTAEGIRNRETGALTHELKTIRRFF